MENIMNAIIANAERNKVINDDDYIGKDGLLYCGKCHTPKQARIEVMGMIKTPPCICKCEKERRDNEERLIKERDRQLRIDARRNAGFPDDEMKNWRFEKDDSQDSKISRIAHNYCDNFKEMKDNGKGLLLFGTVGTGKSFISACIANKLIEQGYHALMTNFARISNTLQSKFDRKQEYLDELNRYDLLVIDDLSAERNTEYMNETVFNIIDARYRSGKPLIVTTNLTSEELKHASDINKQRIYSRLFDMCIPIEVKGVDRRQERLKDDFKKYQNLLGL